MANTLTQILNQNFLTRTMAKTLLRTNLSNSLTQASSSWSFKNGNSVVPLAYKFEFSTRFGSNVSSGSDLMSSMDELFWNRQIWPVKLLTHLDQLLVLAPLPDLEEVKDEETEVETSDKQRKNKKKIQNRPLLDWPVLPTSLNSARFTPVQLTFPIYV